MKIFVPETPIGNIDIPESFVRTQKSPIEDRALFRSIKEDGVFDPVIVLRNGKRFMLVKGSRRIEQSKAAGLPKVPYLPYDVPAGEEINAYALKLRIILSNKRIDLLPSQRGAIVQRMKDNKVKIKAIADHLGVDVDTITNWLAITKYIPPVVNAIDAGSLTMQTARVFVGMTRVGQEAVWRLHVEELTGPGSAGAHQRLRKLYPPAKYPHFYLNAKVVEERLKRYSGKRKVKSHPNPSQAEKKRMLSSFDLKEEEIEELEEEAVLLKREISNAVPLVAAMLVNKHIKVLIPEATLAELEEFARAYVGD